MFHWQIVEFLMSPLGISLFAVLAWLAGTALVAVAVGHLVRKNDL